MKQSEDQRDLKILKNQVMQLDADAQQGNDFEAFYSNYDLYLYIVINTKSISIQLLNS